MYLFMLGTFRFILLFLHCAVERWDTLSDCAPVPTNCPHYYTFWRLWQPQFCSISMRLASLLLHRSKNHAGCLSVPGQSQHDVLQFCPCHCKWQTFHFSMVNVTYVIPHRDFIYLSIDGFPADSTPGLCDKPCCVHQGTDSVLGTRVHSNSLCWPWLPPHYFGELRQDSFSTCQHSPLQVRSNHAA